MPGKSRFSLSIFPLFLFPLFNLTNAALRLPHPTLPLYVYQAFLLASHANQAVPCPLSVLAQRSLSQNSICRSFKLVARFRLIMWDGAIGIFSFLFVASHANLIVSCPLLVLLQVLRVGDPVSLRGMVSCGAFLAFLSWQMVSFGPSVSCPDRSLSDS